MQDEREMVIHPIVADSVMHNARVVSQIRTLTASLFGVAAGVLGLESFQGFLFYFLGTIFVSQLVSQLLAGGNASQYFQQQWSGLWAKDVMGGLMSYILTWTLFYGLVRS